MESNQKEKPTTVAIMGHTYPLPPGCAVLHGHMAAALVARPGTKVWQALALYFKAKGAPQATVVAAGQCVSKLNVLRMLAVQGLVAVTKTPGKVPGGATAIWYKAKLTKAGLAKYRRHMAAHNAFVKAGQATM